jgi:WD40 repeat protein
LGLGDKVLEKVDCLDISADSKRIVVGTARRLQIVDAQTKTIGLNLKDLNVVTAVIFSPDGECVAAIEEGERRIRLRRSTDGTVLRDFTGFRGRLRRIFFSPDGKHLVGAGADGINTPEYLRIWHILSGKNIAAFSLADNTSVYALSPDRKWLATGSYVPSRQPINIYDLGGN